MTEQQTADRQSPPATAPDEAYFGPKFLAHLHQRLHRNPVTGLITKVVVTIAGVLMMTLGLIMMVTPGPGIVGLILGLAILSTEWRWADRWLDAARAAAHRAAEKAREMDPAVRRRRVIAVVLLGVVAVLTVSALLRLFGWPELAVDGWDWVQGLAGGLPELPGMES